MNQRKLAPLGDLAEGSDGDRLFSALAKCVDSFAREHGKNRTSGGFSGPLALRIMASLQKYVDGQPLEEVFDRLLSAEQKEKIANPNLKEIEDDRIENFDEDSEITDHPDFESFNRSRLEFLKRAHDAEDKVKELESQLKCAKETADMLAPMRDEDYYSQVVEEQLDRYY